MPRVKTEDLQEGMTVISDVKNIDDMLLIPAGSQLSARQINILQAWGVTDIEVEKAGSGHDTNPLLKVSSEVVEQMSAELRKRFWKPQEGDPVYDELFRLILLRRVVKQGRQARLRLLRLLLKHSFMPYRPVSVRMARCCTRLNLYFVLRRPT